MDKPDNMGIRDYFAAQVLPSVYTKTWLQCKAMSEWPADWHRQIAVASYKIADEMMVIHDRKNNG